MDGLQKSVDSFKLIDEVTGNLIIGNLINEKSPYNQGDVHLIEEHPMYMSEVEFRFLNNEEFCEQYSSMSLTSHIMSYTYNDKLGINNIRVYTLNIDLLNKFIDYVVNECHNNYYMLAKFGSIYSIFTQTLKFIKRMYASNTDKYKELEYFNNKIPQLYDKGNDIYLNAYKQTHDKLLNYPNINGSDILLTLRRMIKDFSIVFPEQLDCKEGIFYIYPILWHYNIDIINISNLYDNFPDHYSPNDMIILQHAMYDNMHPIIRMLDDEHGLFWHEEKMKSKLSDLEKVFVKEWFNVINISEYIHFLIQHGKLNLINSKVFNITKVLEIIRAESDIKNVVHHTNPTYHKITPVFHVIVGLYVILTIDNIDIHTNMSTLFNDYESSEFYTKHHIYTINDFLHYLIMYTSPDNMYGEEFFNQALYVIMRLLPVRKLKALDIALLTYIRSNIVFHRNTYNTERNYKLKLTNLYYSDKVKDDVKIYIINTVNDIINKLNYEEL